MQNVQKKGLIVHRRKNNNYHLVLLNIFLLLQETGTIHTFFLATPRKKVWRGSF